MKIIKKTILILISISLGACTITPKNEQSWMERQRNACLPTAIAFREGLQKYDIWSEVVIYRWIDKKTNKDKGHAIVAYMYPKGQNQLWTYDFWGSYRARAYKNDPLQIAKEAVKARHEDRNVYYAEFVK
jgi:hypothetical protein